MAGDVEEMQGQIDEIGALSYSNSISEKSDQLRQCQRDPKADCTFLLRQVDRLEREIKDLERKRKRYGS